MSTAGDTKFEAYSGQTRLLVVLAHKDQPVACRVLDLAAADLPWLAKELAFRTVAAVPEAAGQTWRLDVSVADIERRPHLRFRSWTDQSQPVPLADITVPASDLAWLADAMLPQAGLATDNLPDCHLLFQAVGEEHPIIAAVEGEKKAGDFRLKQPLRRQLRLPRDFQTGLPDPGNRVLREVPGGWLRCVFSERLWRRFAAAASAEESVERAYGAPMSARLAGGVWHLEVDEPLVEATDQSTSISLVTGGRRLRALYGRFGGCFAYLHLHPRSFGEVEMTSQASAADAVVAWNLDSITTLPVCMPIALSGDADKTAPGEVSVFSFVGGRLREIPLEIMT